MVKIHAHTMRPATPQRTRPRVGDRAHAHDGAGDGVGGRHRDARACVAMKMATEPPVSAQNPPNGPQLGQAHAHGLHDAPAARHGAEPHGQRSRPGRSTSGISCAVGKWSAEIALRVEQHHDDAHGLLGVVAAVVEAEGRRGQELQAPEPRDRPCPGFALRSSHELADHHDGGAEDSRAAARRR